MTILKRTLAGTPAAMMVTAGLGVLMAGLIKVEHRTIDDKPEQLSFVINETPPDIDPVRNVDAPELRVVEVPPPPPTIATQTSDLPKIELVEIDTKPPSLPIPDVEWTEASFTVSDADARPLVRIPPVMPTRFSEGNHSGRCAVMFDVSAEGSPFNVQITSCSDNVLRRSTKNAVLKWRYQPKIVEGQPTMMTGVRDVIVYQLLDANGRLLPEL